MASKYEFTDLHPDGDAEWRYDYSIQAEGRVTTTVKFRQGKWYVTYEGQWNSGYGISLYNLPALIDNIAAVLMTQWQATSFTPGFRRVHEWARRQTKTTIAKRIKARWQQVVDSVPETQKVFERRMYSVTMRSPDIIRSPHFHADQYAKEDVLRYQPACLKLANMPLYNGETDEQILDAFHHWRSMFSDTQKPYSALNRTLDNLPGSISHSILSYMNQVHLERPVTDRIELICLLHCVSRHDFARRYRHLFMYAKRAELVHALAITNRYTHRSLSLRRGEDMGEFVRFLTDYEGNHDGNVVGLAEKSVEWHRYQHERDMARQAEYYADESLTTLPPIDLPAVEGIRFLSTVGEVRREGMDMGHCIGSYADSAARGDCYLFHADYKGERASAEVSPDGKVQQSFGEHNVVNAASKWARSKLGAWGHGLPDWKPREVSHEVFDEGGQGERVNLPVYEYEDIPF